MIDKVYEISCDCCKTAIYHSFETSKKKAIREAQRYGMVRKGNKHFCDDECANLFQQTASKNQQL